MPVDNAFCQMHATLRTVLNRTARCLQQTDFSNAGSAAQALDAVAAAVHLCREHNANKTAVVFPMLQAFEPSVVAALQQDVLTSQHLIHALNARSRQWQRAATPVQQRETATQLKSLFMRFMIVTRTNLAREELLHGFLAKYCDGAELQLLEEKLDPADLLLA